MLPAALSALFAPLLAASPIVLDPLGVRPLFLDEGQRQGPVLAVKPFLVEWRAGWLCAGPAQNPEPERCVELDAASGDATLIRAVGRDGVMVVQVPSDENPWYGTVATVVVLSRTGVVFAASDVIDVHLDGDAVDVGLRCGPTIMKAGGGAAAIERMPYCPRHQYGARDRVALRVKGDALVVGVPRTLTTEDGHAALEVRVDGHKTAWLTDNGLWRHRGRAGGARTLDPDLSDVDATRIVGPAHIDVLNLRLSARGMLTGHLDGAEHWAENARAFDTWRALPLAAVQGQSPAAVHGSAFLRASMSYAAAGFHGDSAYLDRCGRPFTIHVGEDTATFAAAGGWCHVQTAVDVVEETTAGVTVWWSGADGEDACARLFADTCTTAKAD